MKKFFDGLWAVIALVFRQLWSLFSDKHWDFDPWKAGGWGAFGFATYLSMVAVDVLIKTHDVAQAGIPAGLATAFITVGTFLFGQSVSSDKNLPDKAGGGQ